MKNFRVMLSLLVVALLALGFIAGCGSSSDDGGGDSSTGTVTGTVTDQNSQPISGALCTVSNLEAKAEYSDTTDDSGVYEITSVPSGSWILTISADGFVTQTQ
ncbi:MAG: carboxypeptidase-like regulatory domain-containing protein, partial [Firmicutes bacterium]|nr:carboxypeptidase-like regulatory domain-containing protein [Bacillota bacterium]